MEFEEARPFMESNHPGVISTYQRNGAIHNSIVVCGAYKGNAAFVAVRGNSRKVHNLRRNPHCSVLSVKPDWRSFVIVEGQAQLFDARNTEAEDLLLGGVTVSSRPASGGRRLKSRKDELIHHA